jgi:hypothetical protein
MPLKRCRRRCDYLLLLQGCMHLVPPCAMLAPCVVPTPCALLAPFALLAGSILRRRRPSCGDPGPVCPALPAQQGHHAQVSTQPNNNNSNDNNNNNNNNNNNSSSSNNSNTQGNAERAANSLCNALNLHSLRCLGVCFTGVQP